MASKALGPAGREYHFEDSEFTFPLTATGVDVTSAMASVGKAVSIDTSVTPAAGDPPTVKLAADGDEIFGRLETYENRTQEGQLLATVALRFIGNIAMKAGETPAPGASLIGAGSGTVKTRVALTAFPASMTLGATARCVVYNYDATNNLVNCAFGV